MIGVAGLTPLNGKFGQDNSGKPANAYGQPALKTTDPSNAGGGIDVAVTSSDEPSLKHVASYPGRTVFFSFGFEGINDNTGFATRTQVMQRIFQWFDDKPTAAVTTKSARAGARTQLNAKLQAGSGAKPSQYIWQVGSQTLLPTGKPIQYRFTRPGKYKVRVQITDSLGHAAVSPWVTITVH
jgi:hypothetical protein